jgi:ABC-2 type transport system permease protein
MRLLLRYLLLAARGQLRYRSTLYLNAVAQIALPLSLLAGISLLFARFGALGGWTAHEALLCYGVTHCAFSLAELLARGFDNFPIMLSNGELDRMLVRPRALILQVLGSRLDLSRFGRLGVGAFVLGWALSGIAVEWSFLKLLALALMIGCGAALFSGLFILGAAFSFLTTDGLEVVNIFTDGGREMAQYPMSIYERWLRLFFTFIVPFACVNYLPLLFVLGRGGAGPGYAFLPLAGLAFVLPCCLAWRAGLRRYVSTGS